MAIPTQPSLAAQVRRQIETYRPFAVCDDCLAVLLAATVDEIRAAAVTVAETERFTAPNPCLSYL